MIAFFKVTRVSRRGAGLRFGRPVEGSSLRTCDNPETTPDDWEFDILDADDMEQLREVEPNIAASLELEPAQSDGSYYVNYMWVIPFFTLDELMAFVKSNGQCVICNDGDRPSIEIYDDYRE